MKIKTKKIIFFAVIICSILFIWSNSFRNGDASMNASNGLKKLIIDFFNSIGIDIQNTFFIVFIRKFAHFIEYFILGIELYLFRNFYLQKTKTTLLNITYIGVFSAFTDETIQLIPSLGRSAEVGDVWIDICGVLLAFSVVFVILLIINKNKKRYLQSRKNVL